MQLKYNTMKKKEAMSLRILGKNVTFLMAKFGIDAQTLSEGTGVGVATINNLKRGSGNPTIGTLSSVAEFFDVSAGSLMEVDLSAPQSDDNVKVLPLINFNDLELYINNKNTHQSTYAVEVENHGDESLFAVEITTNSLFPEIESGTICIVSRNEKCCDGDIVLLKIRGLHLCFRRVFIADTGYRFSNIILDSNVLIAEYDDYNIVGVVMKKINKLR